MRASAEPGMIETVALCKTYRRNKGQTVIAVDDLSLSIPPGQVFGFLGANGAGKTTTIKMICGLVTPDRGQVRVNGLDVAQKRGVVLPLLGAVLEGTRNVHWPLSAWENVLYFGHLKGVSGRRLSARGEELLRGLELWDRRHDLVRTYSRGMQQKVAIACALIADPPVVLLDEPTLGLDVPASRTIREWIRTLARDQGKTIVLTTHQLDMAQDLCDHVAIMAHGRLLANQPTRNLLGLFQQEHYQIQVDGHLDCGVDLAQRGLSATEESGHTTITGAIVDQTALHDLLGVLRSLGLPLLSVSRVEPNLEEVFVRLLSAADKGKGPS